ncbi:MAG: tryptophan-rich sensory protein [Erysipelotrichales bacterium]|nr:tryptophan-rich sensory protein [Erysipelotrichales bacterium]
MNKIKNIWYIFGPLALGLIVSLIIKDHIDYEYLVQPKFAPPAYLFGIAWSILYLLMGISFYLYKKNGEDNSVDKTYNTQLILNLIWPIIFFNFKFRFIGTVEIIILDLVVIYMLYLFFKKYRTSFYLNIPYLLWLLFATYLSYSIYLLN